MGPAVPFALLGAVELLAVAGWLCLAAAALFPGLWRRASPPFVVGALVLAGSEVATVLGFGEPASARLAEVRVAGLALLAVGIAGGALQPRRLRRLPRVAPVGAGLPAVVVPLGAPFALGVGGAVAGGLGALGALYAARSAREERDRVVAGLLAMTTAAAGAASACAVPAAGNSTFAAAVLALRALVALGAFAVCARLASRSVLAKVVLAILAGVVAMAAGAVGVVGASVGNAVLADQVQATRQAAQAQQQALATLSDQVELRAQFVVACVRSGVDCASLLNAFSDAPGPFFAAELCTAVQRATGCRPGRPAALAGTVIPAAALDTLSAEPPLVQALRAGGECTSAVLPLGTSPPSLAVVGVVPGTLTEAGCGQPTVHPSAVAGIYAVRYTDRTARALASGGFDVSFLSGRQVLASSLPPAQRGALLAVAGALGQHALPVGGLTEVGQGASPTVSFQPIVDGYDGVQVGELAVSAPAARVVGPERAVLTRLFLTALLVLVAVALLALLLGRRVVAPVRRLTHAVLRVRRGELEVVAGVRGRDEVAALSRSFDAMTEALRGMTGRLRDAADAEADLRRRLETVVASMAEGLVTCGPDGRVTVANPAAAALAGVPAEQLVGRPLAEALPITDPGGAPAPFLSGGRAVGDGLLHRAGGGVVPVQVAVAPLAEDPAAGAVLLLRDTTRDREVERMKTEFLANVSHELRTPLTPIRGYAELLERRGPDLPQAPEYIRTIHESSLRMQRVVDLLVDVAALEAGRVQPARRPTEVGEFVDACLQRWRERWPQRAGDFRRDVAAGLPAVDIDPHWIGRALDELADNAVKYTPARTPITVAAAVAGGGVRVCVRDAGPGIPAERLPELLADFSQADASETRQVGGMGLGLSFVRRLAEGFGVGLHVDSERGRGSEFGLDLPACAARPPRPPAGRRERPVGGLARRG